MDTEALWRGRENGKTGARQGGEKLVEIGDQWRNVGGGRDADKEADQEATWEPLANVGPVANQGAETGLRCTPTGNHSLMSAWETDLKIC